MNGKVMLSLTKTNNRECRNARDRRSTEPRITLKYLMPIPKERESNKDSKNRIGIHMVYRKCGKESLEQMRIPGAGSDTAAGWYLSPENGCKYVKTHER